MKSEKKFWFKKKVLITGHTGFKGSWLSLFLYYLGAKIYGFSLAPQKKFFFAKAKLNKIFNDYNYDNILNFNKLDSFVNKIKPEIVFHLAAEPLVLESYKNPKRTFNVNLIGTLNLFESLRKLNCVKTIIIITTDKVYKIRKKNPYYKEIHQIGATDPYGTSKACVELLSETYKKSFFKKNVKISTARAGNVIGGGDYSKNRIVPDYLKALNLKKKLILRNPNHIRPWQYVLDPIYGYMLLAKKKYLDKQSDKFDSWNFAPNSKDSITVKDLIKLFQNSKFNKFKLKIKNKKQKHDKKETEVLKLSASKAKKLLDWKIKYSLRRTVDTILMWNEMTKTHSYIDVSLKFIKDYFFFKNKN